MAHKLGIDCDPGIDSALALSLALFSPEVEITAVTAVAGIIEAEQSTLNVQLAIEQADTQEVYRRIVIGLLRAAS